MAQTTTPISSNQSVIQLDVTSAGTLVDISGTTTKVSIEPDRESKETFTFGSESALTTVGKTSTKISVEIVYSSTTAEGGYILEAWFYGTQAVSKGSRTIQIDIPDSSTGSRRYSGEVKLSKPPALEMDSSKAEPLIMKAEFMNDGAISWTII